LLTYSGEKAINIDDFDYVLFLYDEISTGNTILNFINAFEKIKSGMNFGVASICNWQDERARDKFNVAGIDTFALITGKLKHVNAKMFDEDDDDVTVYGTFTYKPKAVNCDFTHSVKKNEDINVFAEERLGHVPNRDLTYIFDKVDEIIGSTESSKKIRIVGTEEFMYIPIKVGEHLEKSGHKVVCHSNTRSSIDVIGGVDEFDFDDIENEISTKFVSKSAYDITRETYLYNINDCVDITILITDGSLSTRALEYYHAMFRRSNFSKEFFVLFVK